MSVEVEGGGRRYGTTSNKDRGCQLQLKTLALFKIVNCSSFMHSLMRAMRALKNMLPLPRNAWSILVRNRAL